MMRHRARLSLPHGRLPAVAILSSVVLAAGCMANPLHPSGASSPEAPSAALLAKMASRPVAVHQLPTYAYVSTEPEPAELPGDVTLPASVLRLGSVLGAPDSAGAAPTPDSKVSPSEEAASARPAPTAGERAGKVALPTSQGKGKPPSGEKSLPKAGDAAPAAKADKAVTAGSAAVGAKEAPKPFGAQKKVAVPRPSRTMGAVPWRHQYHASKKGLGIGCKQCHHEMADGEAKACFACHTSKGGGDIMPAKQAYHQNCISCHRKAVAKDPSLKKRAPTICTGCHIGG